jgi:hypothetical protein
MTVILLGRETTMTIRTFCDRNLVLFCMAAALLAGCAPTAEEFFSGGRHSQLSKVHMKAASGEREMAQLYLIPTRFPEATELNKRKWQQAIISWWWAPDKRELMTHTYSLLKPEQTSSFLTWLKLRDPSLEQDSLTALAEMETAFAKMRSGK